MSDLPVPKKDFYLNALSSAVSDISPNYKQMTLLLEQEAVVNRQPLVL